ncbi:MAG: hypothetical protein ABSF70_03930 [Terracidiphilus sp.]|jgi:hypothetical protein
MIRPIALAFAAGMALLIASPCGADETVPVVHNEPITVRILGGKDGRPLPQLHLILIGGYDRNDIHDQLYRQEVLTDAHGQVRLQKQLANLPWLQVWVNKKPLCQANPRGTSFSVELIRRDGLSTPNRCGKATVEDAAGVFNVFVKGKGKGPVKEQGKNILSGLFGASASARAPASVPASHLPEVAVAALPAAALLETPTSTPAEVLERPIVSVFPLSPGPVFPTLRVSVRGPAKAALRHTVKRTAARRASHRTTTGVHKAKPILAACPAQPPEAKAAPAAPVAHSATPAARRKRRPARVLAKAIDRTQASHRGKPSAGVKLTNAAPGKPDSSPKEE